MSATLSTRRVAVLVLWLLVICLSAHVLQDLRPGHVDYSSAAAQGCTLAIHLGVLAIGLPAIRFLALAFGRSPVQRALGHSLALAAPVPPPIPA
jgi:hypothetical protein